MTKEFLNYKEGWVMPEEGKWGTNFFREYAKTMHLADPFSAESVAAYLRSIGAVPFAEYVARAEVAEKERDAWREDAERLRDAIWDDGDSMLDAPRTNLGRALAAHDKLVKEMQEAKR